LYPHPLASEAGTLVMNEGGNAFDASIATQYALAVVYPQAGNIGGGGFMVATTADGKMSLDYRETAPAKAHKDMYIDKKEMPIQILANMDGLLSAFRDLWQGYTKCINMQNFLWKN
jgi:gamma-glutamyltranspeptidase